MQGVGGVCLGGRAGRGSKGSGGVCLGGSACREAWGVVLGGCR